MSNALKGMLISFGAFLIFSLGDAIIKHESRSYAVLQCSFFAALGGLATILILSLKEGGPRRALKSRNMKVQAVRALCLGTEFMLVLYAFNHLPLSNVYTIVLLSPVLTALIAPLATPDRFNPKLLPAIILGFSGVVVALRPDILPVGLPILAALCVAVLFSFGNLIVRRIEGQEPYLVFAFYPTLFTLIASGVWMLVHQPALPALPDIFLMALTGLSSMCGLIGLGKAVQLAPAHLVIPFQYTQIVWGGVLGWAIFGDTLTGSMLAGSLLIAASGILLLRSGVEKKTNPAMEAGQVSRL